MILQNPLWDTIPIVGFDNFHLESETLDLVETSSSSSTLDLVERSSSSSTRSFSSSASTATLPPPVSGAMKTNQSFEMKGYPPNTFVYGLPQMTFVPDAFWVSGYQLSSTEGRKRFSSFLASGLTTEMSWLPQSQIVDLSLIWFGKPNADSVVSHFYTLEECEQQE